MEAQFELRVSHANEAGPEESYPTAVRLHISRARDRDTPAGMTLKLYNWSGWCCRAAGPEGAPIGAAAFDINADGEYGAEGDVVGLDLNGDGWIMSSGDAGECVPPGEPFTWQGRRYIAEWSEAEEGPPLTVKAL